MDIFLPLVVKLKSCISTNLGKEEILITVKFKDHKELSKFGRSLISLWNTIDDKDKLGSEVYIKDCFHERCMRQECEAAAKILQKSRVQMEINEIDEMEERELEKLDIKFCRGKPVFGESWFPTEDFYELAPDYSRATIAFKLRREAPLCRNMLKILDSS